MPRINVSKSKIDRILDENEIDVDVSEAYPNFELCSDHNTISEVRSNEEELY